MNQNNDGGMNKKTLQSLQYEGHIKTVISKWLSDISVTKWVMLKSVSIPKAVQVSKQGAILQENAFELL